MLVEDFLQRWAAAKAAAGLRKTLRECGFTELEPGRWKRTLTPPIDPIEITLPMKKRSPPPALYALVIVFANFVVGAAAACGLAWLVWPL